MDNINPNEVQEPKENLEEEQELLKEPELDSIQQSLIDQFGLDEDADSELIEKMVADKIEASKRLSTAIKQKIGWRTKAQAQTERKTEDTPQSPAQPMAFDEKIIDQKLTEKLEEREWQSLEIDDELKRELKTYAKANSLTAKQALQTPYCKFLQENKEAEQKVEEASIGGKRRTSSTQDFSKVSVEDIDVTTPEGQEQYAKYRDWLKTQK